MIKNGRFETDERFGHIDSLTSTKTLLRILHEKIVESKVKNQKLTIRKALRRK